MIALSSHIDSTKNSLKPLSVTTLEWSSSLLCLLESWSSKFYVLFDAKVSHQALPCCVGGIKDCNLPTTWQPVKDILQCLLANLTRSGLITSKNIHLFSDFHPFRITVVKELVILIKPSSTSLGPLDGPTNGCQKDPPKASRFWAPDSSVVAQIEYLRLHANPVEIPRC